ncbi:unnamed protein product, partial [Rotaria magnacalcarata]
MVPAFLLTYDPELFGKLLPCLTVIGSALPPDYAYSITRQDHLNDEQKKLKCLSYAKIEKGSAYGGDIHSRLVPFEQLTDKEKQKDLRFYQDLIKYINTFGYRIDKNIGQENTYDSNLNPQNLLEYVERVATTMQNCKESSKYSLHETYRLTTKEVRFFGKVVLPLIEKYFDAHRNYFIIPPSLKPGIGYASVKEKEMCCSLFCKLELAFLLRQKITAFVRAIDVSSVMKNSQEMVRASLLPFFNNIAEDLNQTVQNLEQKRYSNIKGTLQRGTTSLAYINI